MHTTSTLLSTLSESSDSLLRTRALKNLYHFILTACGYGLIDVDQESETKSEKTEFKTEQWLRDQLKIIRKNSFSRLGDSMATTFNIALSISDLDHDSIVDINKNVTAMFDDLMKTQAEIITCNRLHALIKNFIKPTGLIDEEKIPEPSQKSNLISALKLIKSAATELIQLETAYLELAIDSIPEEKAITPEIQMIGDALKNVDLEKADALEKSFIALNLMSIKSTKVNTDQLKKENQALEAVFATLKKYESLFAHSVILWEYEETLLLEKIKKLHDLDMNSKEKCQRICELIFPFLKKFPTLSMIHQKPLTAKKILVAIYHALTQENCLNVADMLHSLLEYSPVSVVMPLKKS